MPIGSVENPTNEENQTNDDTPKNDPITFNTGLLYMIIIKYK